MEKDPTPPDGLRWSQERRLEFVDFRLFWDGALNRSQLRDRFGISTPQASLDIGTYLTRFPENLAYDTSAKTYVAKPTFAPQFPATTAHRFLQELLSVSEGLVGKENSLLGFVPPVATVPLPVRTANTDVLRKLLWAVRNGRGLDVEYQSIAREESRTRRITPHAFAHDGARWHVRAYCAQRNGFRDFVIGRILKVVGEAVPDATSNQDNEWHNVLQVVLAPDPTLSPGRRRGIELDYGMKRGRVSVECKQAMLYYLLRALSLDTAGRPVGEVRQVVVDNLPELKPFLPKAGQP